MISYDYIGYIPSLSANNQSESAVTYKVTADLFFFINNYAQIFQICDILQFAHKWLGLIQQINSDQFLASVDY